MKLALSYVSDYVHYQLLACMKYSDEKKKKSE